MASPLVPIAGITAATLVADGIWLYSQHSYHKALFHEIQGEPMEVRLFPAAMVYAIIVAAVYFFAVRDAKSLYDAFGRGAFIGFAMYGVYDFTNFATLKRYTFSMTITDVLWGTFLCSVGAVAGYFLKTK